MTNSNVLNALYRRAEVLKELLEELHLAIGEILNSDHRAEPDPAPEPDLPTVVLSSERPTPAGGDRPRTGDQQSLAELILDASAATVAEPGDEPPKVPARRTAARNLRVRRVPAAAILRLLEGGGSRSAREVQQVGSSKSTTDRVVRRLVAGRPSDPRVPGEVHPLPSARLARWRRVIWPAALRRLAVPNAEERL